MTIPLFLLAWVTLANPSMALATGGSLSEAHPCQMGAMPKWCGRQLIIPQDRLACPATSEETLRVLAYLPEEGKCMVQASRYHATLVPQYGHGSLREWRLPESKEIGCHARQFTWINGEPWLNAEVSYEAIPCQGTRCFPDKLGTVRVNCAPELRALGQ